MFDIMRIDRTAGDASARYRNSAVMKVAGPASDMADQWQLFGLCVGTTVVGLARNDRKLAATGIEMTAAMLLATVLKNVVKNRIERTRPSVVADGGTYAFARGDHDIPELNSFPSGHTAGAVAVTHALARRYPTAAKPALAVASGIALVQMPRAKHYPTDLVAGILVGLVTDRIVLAGRRLALRMLG